MMNRAALKEAMPWLVSAVRLARRAPGATQLRRIYSELFSDRVFTNIYRENMWGDGDSRSGGGSNLQGTRVIRAELPGLITSLGISTMLDVPCGDFFWMSKLDLGLHAYTGGDIVPDLIAANTSRFGSPTRSFITLDASRDEVPCVDLVLCRDLLIHLSLRKISAVLANLKRSGSTWLAASTYADAPVNDDILTGQYRPVNLQAAPFSFPAPHAIFQEDGVPGNANTKYLGVWRMSDLPLR
jgi:hypothetical protein